MQAWEIEGQPEFDFSECYIANYPPLDLSAYKKDRNYNFYKLQNDLLITYNKEHRADKNILWQMFGTIENVVSSLAKKNICIGCNVPDFDGKVFEAAIRVLNYYEKFPYFRAKKLENVAFWNKIWRRSLFEKIFCRKTCTKIVNYSLPIPSIFVFFN